MEPGSENSILHTRVSETETSWIPITPAKPGFTEQHSICPVKQLELPQGGWINLQEFPPQTEGYQANGSESGSGFDNWEAALASKSRGDGFSVCDKFFMENLDNWSNVSFKNLLALADAAGAAATENASICNISNFTPEMEYAHFQSISGTSTGLPFDEPRPLVAPDAPSYCAGGIAIPSELSFDLNSPPASLTDAGSSAGVSAKFGPITPDQNNRSKNDKALYMPSLCTNETAKDTDGLSEVTVRFDFDEDQNIGQPQLVEDESCATKSPVLWENHKPEKGSDQLSDLGKTPQQKPRRRKHRPKVVNESQTKKAANPRNSKPTGSQGITTPKRKYIRKERVSKPEETPLESRTDGTELETQLPVSAGMPKQKRKYVKRKGINQPTAPMEEEISESADSKTTRVTRRSCRRSLNFESESQEAERSKDQSCLHVENQNAERSTDQPSSDVNSADPSAKISYVSGQSISTMNLGQGTNLTIEKAAVGIPYDLTQSMNHAMKSYLSVETQAPCSSTSSQIEELKDKSSHPNKCTRGKCQIVFSDLTHDKEVADSDEHCPIRTSVFKCSSGTFLSQEKQIRELKRPFSTEELNSCSMNATGSHYNSLQVYVHMCTPNEYGKEGTPSMYFPPICKRKRTEKMHNHAASTNAFASKSISEVPGGLHGDSNSNQAQLAADVQNNLNCLLGIENRERSTRKRSKGPTRVRDMASLLQICRQLPNSSTNGMVHSGLVYQGKASQEPHTCMDALVADTRATLTTKKRSKRNVIGHAPAMMSKNVSSIEAIIQQFNQLDIDGVRNKFVPQEQHALVPYLKGNARGYAGQTALVVYGNNGTMIPFDDSFNYIKKKRPRPKVDLDDETNRVWKLLLENINNEGIDGIDEEKVKWWEDQREVFRGRADSFIARMRLVQGDRRFTRWKGSVIDSVVGVFLTQNVSDHLSSSAFISMASRFPIKSNRSPTSPCEELTSEEPEVLDPYDTIEWHKKVADQQTLCQDSMTLQGLKYNKGLEINRNFFVDSSEGIKSIEISKVLSSDSSDFGPDMDTAPQVNKLSTQNNQELPILEGYLREFDDVVSSQNSAVSPQHSLDSIGQTANKTESYCQSSSVTKPTSQDCSPKSFVELLQMAGTTMLHGIYYQENRKDSCNVDKSAKSEDTASNLQRDQDSRSFPLFQDSRLPVNTKENELSPTEQSELSEESVAGTSIRDILAVNFDEVQKLSLENHTSTKKPVAMQEPELSSEVQKQRSRKSTNQLANVLETTSTLQETRTSQTKAVESNLNTFSNLVETIDEMNHNTSQLKGGRDGKEKNIVFDWDSLRKQAQVNGKRTERPADTMDSVDWEAVRCADVKEIAATIKERGMNNMLAERIKDFLNRVIRDHGSVDLEWLRDVPPDKAKEYLLSIRGLGLKSVECVRLLTLHHLAFPVDTNVGRIAVRLGWVPLQPLPESLQLHLLELYPVLESIQKYLWPRLCKLDQGTLYELHYQMITFGKVFCTKSKPNCNSCPMRGECRHFASAFASARLALPAPEEKSIVSTTENKEADRGRAGKIDHLLLPQPDPNHHMKLWSQATISEPIIEVPGTPEPIIVEVPSTPEPEQIQELEVDIEDTLLEDDGEIPTIDLNIEQLNQNLQNYMQRTIEIEEGGMSKALVVLTPEAASIPMPKLKNINRLRTEHRVYEIPDNHLLVKGFDKREPDDPCPYLLAIWTPGETINSVQPPERRCDYEVSGNLCNEETCFSCNSVREARSQTVRGTILIPCRTAMRGSFPLNGTYFQVNEVFADHESSHNPIDVPRDWLWNLQRRTVYFGTSIPTIFKGLSDKEIQYCFWRGFVCVRGFDRKVRAPRPLIGRLHFPASKLTRTRGKMDES